MIVSSMMKELVGCHHVCFVLRYCCEVHTGLSRSKIGGASLPGSEQHRTG